MTTSEDRLNGLGSSGSSTCRSQIADVPCTLCLLVFFQSRREFLERVLALLICLQLREQLTLLVKHLLTWCSGPCSFVAGRLLAGSSGCGCVPGSWEVGREFMSSGCRSVGTAV